MHNSDYYRASRELDAAGDPVNSAIFTEGLQVGRVSRRSISRLLVDNTCKLEHALLFYPVGHPGKSHNAIEPGLVPHVVLGERDPLGTP